MFIDSENGKLICPALNMDGSYNTYHAHFVNGLFLSGIIQCCCNVSVDLDVLVQGNAFEKKDRWWDGSGDERRGVNLITKYFFESRAFADIKSKPNKLNSKPGPKHVRVIVWIYCVDHTFAIGWDFHKPDGGRLQFTVFPVDCNPISEFGKALLVEFHMKLNEIYSGDVISNIHEESMCTEYDIDVSTDFPCMPFLARSTLYLSQLEDLRSVHLLSNLKDRLGYGVEQEERLYLVFEDIMLDFAEQVVYDTGNAILLCKKFSEDKFLNISDICLENVETLTASVIGEYYFNGFDLGFVPREDFDPRSSCTLASQLILECRQILDNALVKFIHL